MKHQDHKAAKVLERYGYWLIRNRWGVICLILLAALVLALQIRHIRMDMALEAHLDPTDPALQIYQEFRNRYGNDEVMLVGIATADVFTHSFLEKLQRLHQELEAKTPYLETIMSLVNARLTRGKDNQLIVGEFLEALPADQDGLNALRDYALHHPNYVNKVVSADGSFTTVVITANQLARFEPGAAENSVFNLSDQQEAKQRSSPYGNYQPALTKQQTAEVVNAVRKILDRYRADDFQIYFSGNPVVTEYLGKRMSVDMGRFMAGALLLTFLLLFVLFRRISGILLPLIVVLLGVLLSISLMAAMGVSLKSSTVILPSFLLAVGIGDSVHFLAIFYRNLSQGTPKQEALVATILHSGKPIIYTSITTAAGLWSLSTSKVALVAELGIFAGNGVIICLILSFVLLPALVAVIPFKPKQSESTARQEQTIDRFLGRAGRIGSDHPRVTIAVAVLVVLLSGLGIARLRFAHDVLTWLPASSDVRKDTEVIDRRLGGTINIEMLVNTGKENGLYQPEVLNGLDRISTYLRALKDAEGNPRVGNVFSPADMIKEIHFALNEEDPGAWKIPEQARLIAQEFFLFENSGANDLESLVDIQFSTARLTARIPWRDVSQNNALIEEARAQAARWFSPPTQVTVTGMTSLFAKIGHETMISMRNSYFIAGAVIMLLMCLLLSSVKWGLVSMIPNLLPIIVTLGLMGWFDIPVDVFTMTIGSIALGLCVDDTIHFMHKFFDYYRQTGEVKASVQKTLTTTGRAMLFTSLVLFCSFMIYTLASLSIVIYFGILIAITIVFALLADLVLAPALLQVLVKNKRE